MANINISNRNLNGLVIFGATFEDNVLTAAAAVTWPAGSVLARRDSDSKLVRFNPAGAAGTEIPLAVLTTDVEFTAASDRTERPAISGEVRRGKLVDSTDTALTQAAIDQLRGFTIIALNVRQLSELDNQ